MKKIFILGLNSFSGSYFADYASNKGYIVFGCYRTPKKKILLPYETGIKKIKIGDCQLLSKGKDLTVITCSLSTVEIMNLKKIINKSGITFDHIDLLSIKPIDYKSIKKSLLKTKNLLILDSISNPICSVGSEIISLISRDKNIKLKNTPSMLTLPDISSPTSFYHTKNYIFQKRISLKK